jgi:hypothetical protein
MKCKLSEFGECQREFTPLKDWGEFCCSPHRKRWHYLNRCREAVEDAEARRDERLNGHVNGHDVAKPKLTLAALGLAPAPKTQPQFKRRKLNTRDASGERA